MIDAELFARDWIAGWNARDLDAILAHYAEDVVFLSPRAAEFTGSARVVGKTALRAYWTKALDRIQTLHFELERVYAGVDCIAIVYISNGATRVCETMEFRDGLVMHGIVTHAA